MSSSGFTPAPTDEALTVLTRPGCMFSDVLLAQLDEAEIPVETADIWDDEDAAAHLRSVTSGDETVPTVLAGDAALVDPSLREVLTALAEHAPTLLPGVEDAPGGGAADPGGGTEQGESAGG